MLPVPPEVLSNPSARQILSVWFDGDRLHAHDDVQGYRDPADWGVLLADIARDVASDMNRQLFLDRRTVLATIRDVLNKELDHPTEWS